MYVQKLQAYIPSWYMYTYNLRIYSAYIWSQHNNVASLHNTYMSFSFYIPNLHFKYVNNKDYNLNLSFYEIAWEQSGWP